MADPTLERYQTLKRLISDKQREADKAQGALDEIMKQLKKEYGCKTLEEAQTLLKGLSAKEASTRRKFEIKLKKFEKKWKGKL